MTKIFKLPKNVRSSEELGLHLVFQDVTIRGSQDSHAQVIVTEEGIAGCEVKDTYHFESWDDMKEQYPTLLDFLQELSYNDNWNAAWRENDRIFFIETSVGHEGLYDMKKTVWFDAMEQDEEVA